MASSCDHVVGHGSRGISLASVFEHYLAAYQRTHRLSWWQLKVLEAIRACRTGALGGHVYRCNQCGYKRHEYDSCRNRHCPQCQVYRKVKWVAARLGELLPIPYYHAVFTLPHSLNELALYNKVLFYDIFFKATSGALNAFAASPRFLGAKLGFIGILHTWGQALNQHIHLHYIVTGGGLSEDGQRWVNLPHRKSFLFPAKAVSSRVRRDFANLLWKAYREKKVVFPDSLGYLKEASAFHGFLNKVAWEPWVAYMKEPFGGPETVVKYIGRYTHRVAISDSRLQSMSGGKVTFSYKRYRDGKVYPGTMSLSSDEFIRRFLLHVIPKGFKRIRHFGFLANACRREALAEANRLLTATAEKLANIKSEFSEWVEQPNKQKRCPECKTGVLEIWEVISPRSLAPG